LFSVSASHTLGPAGKLAIWSFIVFAGGACAPMMKNAWLT
jgi:hypothetical protein